MISLLGLRCSREKVRREMILLIRSIAVAYPASYSYISVLCSDNPDLDFAANIVHIQTHRRRKAVTRLLHHHVANNEITVQCANEIILPLIQHFILESRHSLGSINTDSSLDEINFKMRNKSSLSTENTLLEETIRLIAAFARVSTWPQYYRLLLNYMNMIKLPQHQPIQKVLVRLVCAITEQFSFNLDRAQQSLPQQNQSEQLIQLAEKEFDQLTKPTETEAKEPTITEEGEESEEEELEEKKAKDSEMALKARIELAVSKNLLPHLHDLLVGVKKEELDLVRLPVALSIVKFLQKLPIHIFQPHFIRLFASLINQLQRREQQARDITRRTISEILLLLGPYYFHYMVYEVKAQFTRGYQLHVLTNLLHDLLEKLVTDKEFVVGSIDHSIPLVVEILLLDITGEAAKQKQVDQIKNSYKEAKTNKSYESFQYLARLILPNESSLSNLMNPLKQELMRADNTATIKDLDNVFSKLVAGFMFNSAFHPQLLLHFCFNLIKEATSGHLPAENSTETTDNTAKLIKSHDLTPGEKKLRMRKTKEDTLMIQQLPRQHNSAARKGLATRNLSSMLLFGLSLFHQAMKKHNIPVDNPTVLAMLDGYIELLRDCCLLMGNSANSSQSANNSVVDLSLKCCVYLLRVHNLPSLSRFTGELANFMFSLLHNGNSVLFSSTFKALAVLIRYNTEYEINQAQVRLLLQFVKQDLSNSSRQTVAFALLKAILFRKFLLPEIYDLMQEIQSLLLTAQQVAVQRECADCLVLFLLDYPLGEKRLNQQLAFLVNNTVNYAHAQGRLMLLQLLYDLIYKFPAEIVDKNAEFLLLPLAQLLANDNDAQCKQSAANTVQQLFNRASPSKQNQLFSMISTWLSADKLQTQLIALQIAGITLQPNPSTNVINEKLINNKFFTELLAQIKQIFSKFDPNTEEEQTEAKTDEGSADSLQNSSETAQWRVLYAGLITLEKCWRASPKFSTQQFLSQGFWSLIKRLNLHFHSWVRLSAARITGFILSTVNLERLNSTNYLASTILGAENELFELGKVCCVQLNSLHLGEPIAEQIVKNLVFLINAANQSNYFLRAQNNPNSQEGSAELEGEEGKSEEEMADSSGEGKNFFLNWLIHRLSYSARTESIIRRQAIFTTFAALNALLTPQQLQNYLIPLLHPLIRAASLLDSAQGTKSALSVANLSTDSENSAETLGKTATEIIDLIQSKFSSAKLQPEFVAAYSRVHSAIQSQRESRKRAQKQLAVINPTAAAKQKVAKNLKKREKRRQSVQTMKILKHLPHKSNDTGSQKNNNNAALNGFNDGNADTPYQTRNQQPTLKKQRFR
jgi:U3 small nucleolar RNA-associated protein 20